MSQSYEKSRMTFDPRLMNLYLCMFFSGTVGSRSIKSIFSWTKPHQVYLHNSRGLKFDLKTNKQKYHKYHKRFYFDVYDSKSKVSKIIWFWFSGERYSIIIVLLAITCWSIRTTRMLYFWSTRRRKFEKTVLVVYPT